LFGVKCETIVVVSEYHLLFCDLPRQESKEALIIYLPLYEDVRNGIVTWKLW